MRIYPPIFVFLVKEILSWIALILQVTNKKKPYCYHPNLVADLVLKGVYYVKSLL